MAHGWFDDLPIAIVYNNGNHSKLLVITIKALQKNTNFSQENFQLKICVLSFPVKHPQKDDVLPISSHSFFHPIYYLYILTIIVVHMIPLSHNPIVISHINGEFSSKLAHKSHRKPWHFPIEPERLGAPNDCNRRPSTSSGSNKTNCSWMGITQI